MEPATLVFLVIVSNAGGEGKTLLARLMKALWQLLGQKVQILDGDAGNFAAKIAELSSKVVGWTVGPLKAQEIVAATRGQHVIFDLGANSLASAQEIVDLLPALQAEYAAAGYQTVAYMPVSTNKIGAIQGIENLEQNLENFEKYFVKVNRDGSNTFDKGLESRKVIQLGYFAPGLQNYIDGPGRSLAQSVTEPPHNYRVAASFVIDWMRSFATQPIIKDVLGDVLPVLQSLSPAPPPKIRFNIWRLEDATSDALVLNIYKSRILDAIDEEGWSKKGLIAVTQKLDGYLI